MIRGLDKMTIKTKTAGFTLLETLMVVVLIGLLIGTTWPSVSHLRSRYELEKAVWEVHTRMNYLKYLACRNAAMYRLKIYQTGYIIEKYNNAAEQWERVQIALLDGVNLEANNQPTFHTEGTVSNLATIYVFNKAGKYKLTLAISGRIKVNRL